MLDMFNSLVNIIKNLVDPPVAKAPLKKMKAPTGTSSIVLLEVDSSREILHSDSLLKELEMYESLLLEHGFRFDDQPVSPTSQPPEFFTIRSLFQRSFSENLQSNKDNSVYIGPVTLTDKLTIK